MSRNGFMALMALAMVGWGLSWVNAKVLSAYITPYELAFLRYAIGAATMIPLLHWFKKPLHADLKTLGLALVGAVLLIAYTNYFLLGTKYGTASLGGAFVTTLIPINTFLILVLFFGRPISKKDALALMLGAVGVMSIVGVWHLELAQVLTRHNLYFILASLIWPLLTLVSARSTRISPLVFTFYLYVFTALLSLPLFSFEALDLGAKDGIFWFNLAGISLVATTFSNSIYFLGIEKLGAREVSSFIFLVPFAAMGLGVLLLGEKTSAWMVFGTVLTLLAVSMLNNIPLFRFRKSPKKP